MTQLGMHQTARYGMVLIHDKVLIHKAYLCTSILRFQIHVEQQHAER